jgi:hypothetical protein
VSDCCCCCSSWPLLLLILCFFVIPVVVVVTDCYCRCSCWLLLLLFTVHTVVDVVVITVNVIVVVITIVVVMTDCYCCCSSCWMLLLLFIPIVGVVFLLPVKLLLLSDGVVYDMLLVQETFFLLRKRSAVFIIGLYFRRIYFNLRGLFGCISCILGPKIKPNILMVLVAFFWECDNPKILQRLWYFKGRILGQKNRPSVRQRVASAPHIFLRTELRLVLSELCF